MSPRVRLRRFGQQSSTLHTRLACAVSRRQYTNRCNHRAGLAAVGTCSRVQVPRPSPEKQPAIAESAQNSAGRRSVQLAITSQLAIKFLGILKKSPSWWRAKNKNTHRTCVQKPRRGEERGERLPPSFEASWLITPRGRCRAQIISWH